MKLVAVAIAFSIAISTEASAVSGGGLVVFVLEGKQQGVSSDVYEVESNTWLGKTGSEPRVYLR